MGHDSRVFGSLIHRQDDPAKDWNRAVEAAPTLGHHVLVGFNATVIGGVEIGRQSIVSVGAIVTKDVPRGSIVTGLDCAVHHSESTMKVARSSWFRGS